MGLFLNNTKMIPARVRITKYVRGESLNEPALSVGPGEEYFVSSNELGAVFAVLPDGQELGLMPDEFEVIAYWHVDDAPKIKPDDPLLSCGNVMATLLTGIADDGDIGHLERMVLRDAVENWNDVKKGRVFDEA